MRTASRNVVAAGVWVGWRQYLRLEAPYRGYAAPEQFVEVPGGLGTKAIGKLLVDAGVVCDLTTWRLAVLAKRTSHGAPGR